MMAADAFEAKANNQQRDIEENHCHFDELPTAQGRG
jgi:hypothetical protein